jgi:hypothetical protein
MSNKKILPILLALGVYLISAGISYSVFSKSTSPTDPDSDSPLTAAKTNDYEALEFDQNQPKTETCPINGAKFSKQQRQWWEKHRPLGIMLENHTEARPHSGLSFADVVYEAVAEGGITRFLAVYYCQDAGITGPVRSARTYFMDMVSEYGDSPLYAHVGGANTPGPANALGQVEDYGWSGYNDLNQFSVGFPTYRRDEARAGRSVATEHTMYTTTSKLWKVAEERDLSDKNKDGDSWDADFRPYQFKADAPASSPNASSIHIEHWDGQPSYAIDWKYDRTTNSYLRVNGGQPHNDRNTNKQIAVKNVIVLYMTERRANDGYEGNLHLLYGTKGSGNAVIFMDGKEIKGKWTKKGRTDRTIITANGSEVKFNPGTQWFHILPIEGVVDVN